MTDCKDAYNRMQLLYQTGYFQREAEEDERRYQEQVKHWKRQKARLKAQRSKSK